MIFTNTSVNQCLAQCGFNNGIKGWVTALAWLCCVLIVAWSPFSGGPRLPSLVLSVIGLWWLYQNSPWIFRSQAVKRWLIVFLLLWVPVLASLPSSLHAKSTTEIALILPLFFFSGTAILYVLCNKARHRLLQYALLLVSLLWIANSLFQLIAGADVFGNPMQGGRVTGFFHDLHQGLILAIILPVVVALLAQKNRGLGILLLFMTALVIVLSGARTYLVYLVLCIAGFSWVFRKHFHIVAVMVAIPVLVLFFAQRLTPEVYEVKSAQTLEISKITESSQPLFNQLDRILSYRMAIWETGWNMFKARPVFGVGSKAFEDVYRDFSTTPYDPFMEIETPHAHQMYVAIAAETGAVGLLGIILIVVLSVRWYLSASQDCRRQAWPFGLGLLIIAFPLNSQPVLFIPWWFPVMLLVFCAMLASLEPESSD